MDPQSVRYFHPLSKVSSLLSKRNPLDTLDSPHRRRSRRRARHAAALRCGVRPPLSEVGIVGGEYKIGEYNGSERCQPALGTAAVDTPPRQRGGWLAQLLVCYSSFFICLPGPPAPPGRCRGRSRLSATTQSHQTPPARASSMGARRCWLDTTPPRRQFRKIHDRTQIRTKTTLTSLEPISGLRLASRGAQAGVAPPATGYC